MSIVGSGYIEGLSVEGGKRKLLVRISEKYLTLLYRIEKRFLI
jgi:hypothetical protein